MTAAVSLPNVRGLSRLGPRGTFGMALLAACQTNPKVLALTADLAITAGLERFRTQLPERFFNVGIAEQNLVGIAAGLADDGWQPFAVTFANFAAFRSNEFVRHHLGYMRQPVVLVGIGAGFAMGQFGTTHYSLEDVSNLRAIPNLAIVSPGDCVEVFQAVHALVDAPGPTYLRLSGAPSMPPVNQGDTTFHVGRARILSEGCDIMFVATGSMLAPAVAAAESLRADGTDAGVINMHTIKPLDDEALLARLGSTRAFVTVEEHSVIGGLGSAVAELLSEVDGAPSLLRIGVPDAFPRVGSYEYVLDQCGLTASAIVSRVGAWLNTREMQGS